MKWGEGVEDHLTRRILILLQVFCPKKIDIYDLNLSEFLTFLKIAGGGHTHDHHLMRLRYSIPKAPCTCPFMRKVGLLAGKIRNFHIVSEIILLKILH